MTVPNPDEPPPAEDKRERTVEDVLRGRIERRRERIRAEIRRNRAGGHKVPTWVLAVILAAFLAGWLYLIITS
jgi:hypothetical protein